ncbi:helix-turn-helix transcriptional regulator [Candidatus Bathyarchaeota archaeon A05DMB-2]|jgi:DNA-binding transcriptional ArsR family regulator|nr:helix-turn-helix transcriptional regulator [Candidatus Bathyarchaeota archaeon A05DMB-2]
MRDWELRIHFEKVLRKLDVIDAKVSAMPQVQVQVSNKFLPTVNALCKLARAASASEVAQITGRSRATESAVLNELVGRGLVVKSKQGRRKVFSLKEENYEGQTVDSRGRK